MITDELQWAEHISSITASEKLGIIYKNLKKCPPFIKNLCYKS